LGIYFRHIINYFYSSSPNHRPGKIRAFDGTYKLVRSYWSKAKTDLTLNFFSLSRAYFISKLPNPDDGI